MATRQVKSSAMLAILDMFALSLFRERNNSHPAEVGRVVMDGAVVKGDTALVRAEVVGVASCCADT